MARPKANELTERELEIMQVFWDEGEMTATQVRERLAENGRDLALTTVATLIKILVEKNFVLQKTFRRPFLYEPVKTFDEVSGNLLSDMIRRVFGGSREQLLIRLMDQKKLTKRERQLLEEILREKR